MTNMNLHMGNNTRMIKIKNMVNKTVGVRLPEYGINKKWAAKGQVIPLPFDTVADLLWHTGFRTMIDRGILYIEDMQDKIDLGLEPEDATEPQNIKVLTDQQIKELLTSIPLVVFEKQLSELSATQQQAVVNYAIANELGDVQKAEVLKKYTGLDILKSITQKRQVAEAEARQAERKKNNDNYR